MISPNDLVRGGTALLNAGKTALDYGAKLKQAITDQAAKVDLPGKTGDPDIIQSQYDYKNYRFPEDISSSYNNHYMMININVSNYSNYREGVLANEFSTADVLRGLDNPVYIPRQTRRTSKTIVLYMPNTVVFSQANQYEDISLTGIVAEAAVQLGAGGAGRKVYSGLQTAAKAFQMPINPKTEVLFSNTHLRTFQFDFLFAPSSQQETELLKNIIYELRFHSAPELLGLGGLLWTPPSEFDISFYHNNQENTNIPKISTCVMENLDVDYAPTGVYSTFSTGYPVAVRVSMRLKEVEVIHKKRVKQGF